MEEGSTGKKYNLVNPKTPTQIEFARELASALGRPCIAPMPGFVVSAMFGEMGRDVLLNGSWCVPKGLLDEGFVFEGKGVREVVKG